MGKSVIRTNGPNKIGTKIILSSYTIEKYVFPCDGYVRFNCAASSTARAAGNIISAEGSAYFIGGLSSNATYAYLPVFVKQGMKFSGANVQNGGAIEFWPLVW